MALRQSGSACLRAARGRGGRLLSEFLISLGLFFLILTASLVILGSASNSAARASLTREAVSLAREGMEQLLATAPTDKPMRRRETFGGRENEMTYQRFMQVTPLSGERQGMLLLRVEVDWEGGNRPVRLERYVSRV